MLLLSRTLRHVGYITTQQSMNLGDRTCPCSQSKADFLVNTHTNRATKVDTCLHTHMYYIKNEYTHTAKSISFKPYDENGTSELNIGVFVACHEM